MQTLIEIFPYNCASNCIVDKCVNRAEHLTQPEFVVTFINTTVIPVEYPTKKKPDRSHLYMSLLLINSYVISLMDISLSRFYWIGSPWIREVLEMQLNIMRHQSNPIEVDSTWQFSTALLLLYSTFCVHYNGSLKYILNIYNTENASFS